MVDSAKEESKIRMRYQFQVERETDGNEEREGTSGSLEGCL